jgi:outer membrane protein assembly factor BamB
MYILLKNRSVRTVLPPPIRPHSGAAGNVLIYVVVLMLIFGVLGVVMVSLFTSSTASTVTRNDTRRARYMAESGMRYAFSEMRKADFDLNLMINTLNTTTYKIGSTETFTINIFSPWMDSSRIQSSPFDGPLTLLVPIGEIPTGYVIPPNNIYAINYEFTTDKPTVSGSWAEISSVAGQTVTTLNLNLNQIFNAGEGERICFAVKPTEARQVTDGGELYVAQEAAGIFPRFGGAFSIGRNEYFYEELIDETDSNSRVVLKNLSKRPDAAWGITASTSDYVILSPRNYLVVPTGTSDGTVYGGDYLFGKGIYDASSIRPGSRKPDITAADLVSNLSEQESDTRFFETNLVDQELDIGGGTTDEFGSAFFNANMSIGGDQDYCAQGACLFNLGIRAFFLLNFRQQGDGITFTLLSKGFGALGPPNNSASSVGGDFALGETMGYAGDSRLDAAGTTFLAPDAEDRGLDPPKIAVEFDTWTNNRVDDPPPDYCVDASTVNANTRNDPLSGNKDAVQYVFWGRTSFLNIPCRDNNPLYDDNRHDADGEEPTEEWRFATSGLVGSSPAIGSDGAIYVISAGKLYAINPDGSQRWVFTAKILGLSPAYDDNDTPADISDDTIYAVGAGDGNLYAISTGNVLKWSFDAQGDLDGAPTVGPDHTVYAGRDYNAPGDPGRIIAINPDGTPRGLNWPFQIPTAIENDIDGRPFVDDNGTPADTTDDTIYAGCEDNFFYAINYDGTPKWSFETGSDVISTAAIAADGTIYVGSIDNKVYAFKTAARVAGLLHPQAGEWVFSTGADVRSSPAVDPNDGTIYIGSDDGHLYAINPNGTEKWRFPPSGSIAAVQSSPLIDLDGTIYFGSNDTIVYAVNPDGTEKWQFATGGPVISSPALGTTGFIHVGSDDTNVYTISQFGNPRNFKDEDKSAGKLLTFEDLGSSVSVDSNTNWLNGASTKGSWAVRLEVDRSLVPDADGEFDYELRLWMRQCPDQTDFPCSNILGTFFQDTRIAYDYTAVQDLPMRQRFRLSGVEQDAFQRFFFGFTGATVAEALDATISQFQLSFIRPGDPVVDCDSVNWPVEPPLADCIPEL